MSDEETSVQKVPPEPTLFKILCCPITTKTGEAIIQKLYHPYEKNQEDKNIIIGSRAKGYEGPIPKKVRKIIDVSFFKD